MPLLVPGVVCPLATYVWYVFFDQLHLKGPSLNQLWSIGVSDGEVQRPHIIFMTVVRVFVANEILEESSLIGAFSQLL